MCTWLTTNNKSKSESNHSKNSKTVRKNKKQKTTTSHCTSCFTPSTVNPSACSGCGLVEDYCYCFIDTYDNQYTPQPSSYFDFEPHSGTTNDASISKASTDSRSQNVQFLDQKPSYAYDVDSEMDPTRMLQDSTDADLGNFFSRPIKIAEQEWGTGTQLAFDIDPWNLYFTNPRVINRIANFKLMRANLHVKIVINGNGFQYGRALVSYLPLNQFDRLSSNAALIRQDLVQASQQPHIFLDPTTSTGGEMCLPFFWHENYIDVVDGNWSQLGQLFFRSINDLKHANGASDQVTVSVFAWATDMSVNVLTSRNPTLLSPQAGEEVDEANNKGVVSGPATAIAKMSNALTAFPPIAPFALATSQIATGVASLARTMGYCRPPLTKNPDPLRPTPTSSLAVTTVPDTAQKLTVDDKQELTIDPRIAGIGGSDALSIKEIAKRESYLTTFSWDIGTPPETLLFNSRINPVIWAESSGAATAYHFPACAMAALPFKYWTGSMTFRFQVVCSAFHKGRLKFVYDPDFLEDNAEYNVNYLEVIDIADKQDFSITIGNGQTVSLLEHYNPGPDSSTEMFSTTRYTTQGPGNGVLGVYVVNELTTPNSEVNNNIEVNVFVSMSDDFEVFVPTNNFQNFVFKPQSGVEFSPQSGTDATGAIVPESQNTEEPSAPQQALTEKLGPDWQDNSMLNMVFTGESILSFRQLLKRYNLHERVFFSIGNDNANRRVTLTRNMFPFLRGNVAGAVNTTTTAAPYNYCNTLLLHWVMYAFQGWRGSIRRKMLTHNTGFNALNGFAYVQREPEFTRNTVYRNVLGNLNKPTTIDAGAYTIVKNDDILFGTVEDSITGTQGTAYLNTAVNPVVEFESPYYSTFRFYPGKVENWTDDNLFCEGYSYMSRIPGDAVSHIDTHVATGEDFQVYFWTGLPRMYYEEAPPLPNTTP